MLPKHHKTSFFLKTGLFDNLSSFRELEDRISNLPTTIEEGDAFEVFAEAYLSTQKIEQAEEVWPFKSIPSRIKQDLSLGTNQQDMGVDGVLRTVSGEHNAYQAKFRTGRKSLTWRELSTFMGLTDKVNQRVLFTNSNDLPAVINERTGFHCIRGNDLDRLEHNDFETILKWLKSGVSEVERKAPRPYQDEAIKDILTTLEHEDRATALMACGTGKTLVALWVSEQMECQNILVLLPSLALVRQTLHEWLGETCWQHLSYLCVCSDPTVASKELDNIIINQSDLDFSVTTESRYVKQFLSQNTKSVKIVFSTYQSTHIVAEGMNNNSSFDLGIFDEAHKTAGREDAKFGFALKDKNINIKKRLFLTATPRHYNINKKDKDGDSILVYSMDNPDVYGNVAHELSFAKAARQDIICNYKVIISVVTSKQVSKELLKRGEVLIEGDVVNAQKVASHIAFKEAIEKYNIKRIFSFHKSVSAAKSFTGKGPESVHTQLPVYNTFHVNGTMSTASRESIINEFKNSAYSIISNARCLTEGVNLPSVDMVAFMSPKKSKIDIVQATGRAMRNDPNNPDKTLGYILVPLYLEIAAGESIEEAVEKADFVEVWNVLQALQEHDEILADIIGQLQEDRGKGDGGGGIGPIDIIGVDISLKTLQESITAVCIDKLGFTWDFRYGELIKYKEQFGDCNVPSEWTENKQLANWVGQQRNQYQKDKLREDRIKRLEDIGFEWNKFELQWEKMFIMLKEYKDKHGDCNVPLGRVENKQLTNWVSNNRSNYRDKKISEDRIKLLEDIGFVWDTYELQWEEIFAVLKEYKNHHGDCNVPLGWVENNQLANWVGTQRRGYGRGILSKDQIKQLEEIGFEWDTLESQWEGMIGALKEYKNHHGDCNVPSRWAENNQLATWVSTQRENHRNKKISDDRSKRLEKIGFEWDPSETYLEAMFDALKEYKKNHGDCNVPQRWAENKQLANWVGAKRNSYRKGKLSEDRIKRLENIGFEWDTLGSQWEEMFGALKEYKNHHGNYNIPSGWTENQPLANWVGTQRAQYNTGKLSEDRIKRLEDIGFEWKRLQKGAEEKWEEIYNALKEYKEVHGDCNVPSRWLENQPLANWVGTQRTQYNTGKLSEDRIKHLENIGFEWKSLK